MWYFAWILGVLLACACAIINVLWLEMVVKDAFRGKDDEFPISKGPEE
jgi:cyd operon protein YbgT